MTRKLTTARLAELAKELVELLTQLKQELVKNGLVWSAHPKGAKQRKYEVLDGFGFPIIYGGVTFRFSNRRFARLVRDELDKLGVYRKEVRVVEVQIE